MAAEVDSFPKTSGSGLYNFAGFFFKLVYVQLNQVIQAFKFSFSSFLTVLYFSFNTSFYSHLPKPLILLNILIARFVPEQILLTINLNQWPSHHPQKDDKTNLVKMQDFPLVTEHVLPSGRLVPNIMAFHLMAPTHKWISLTQIWNLTPNFSLCFKINDGNVKTLGYLSLNICNYTILYDPDEHEFTSH